MPFFEFDLGKIIDSKKCKFSEEEIQYIMYQFLLPISYMHQSGYLHRDVKPSNFLLSKNGEVAMIDFGLARLKAEEGGALTKNVGTRWYRPPELIFGENAYGESADVWAAGCVFAELVLNEPLFPGTSDIDQLTKIFSLLGTPNELNWPDAKSLPCFFQFEEKKHLPIGSHLKFKNEEAVRLIGDMLQLDPKKRPSIKQVLESTFFEKKDELKDQFAQKLTKLL